MEREIISERPIQNICGKLVNIMAEVSHVAKNGTNDFHHYKYATASDVLEKVNETLCKYGIASLAQAKLISMENVVNAKGNQEHLATVMVSIKLVDTESGESVIISGLGNGQDSGDKAVMKANTAAIKYAYLMTFNISTGDDPEADRRTDEFGEGVSQQSPFPFNSSSQEGEYVPRNVRRSGTKNSGYNCVDCGMAITAKVDGFSKSRFGRSLCMDCQKQQQSA
ncbi:MAG: ERF family protein [Selenomonadaceae bacterium]|nr:ERF family protein [Selenomonadaceae bacterium]